MAIGWRRVGHRDSLADAGREAVTVEIAFVRCQNGRRYREFDRIAKRSGVRRGNSSPQSNRM